MNRANFSCLFVFLAFPLGVMAQQPTDSVQTRQLDEVKVTAKTQSSRKNIVPMDSNS